MDMKHRAFSLIELLVVIAIMGILIAIATVSYSTIQKRARDSRRTTDLKAIQQAMEQYHADSLSAYPGSCSGLSTTYLPSGMPSDPKTGIRYDDDTLSTCGADSYCFCASMEASSGNTTTDCFGALGAFYCIRNVQ